MRRLLFFAGQRMLAYHWSRGRFRAAHAFDADAQGYQDFEHFLRSTPRRPVRLIVDMIEEGFRIESMPRAFGADRKSLVQRLLMRHFRTTAYRHLSIQERLPSGRRDYRVLISGLTNPELLNGWVDIINRAQVPLEGIYSLPLVGEQMLHYLGSDRRKALVITQQSAGAVRQSFYDNGRLRLSRLVPIRYEGEEGYAGFVTREVNNTLRFLEGQRLLRRSESMHVHIIGPSEHVAELKRGLNGDDMLRFETLDYSTMVERLGIGGELPTEFADGLYAQLLLRQSWPSNHYATAGMRTHHFHRLARIGLSATAAGVLVAGLAVAGGMLIQGRLYESYTLEAKVEASQYQRLYDELLRKISVFPLKAAYVKDAVDMVRELDRSLDARPERMMGLVGEALNRHPNITVAQMRWLSDTNAESLPEKRALARGVSAQTEFAAGPRYEIAVLKGSVTGFGSSYREAVNLFDRFVAELQRDERFDLVRVQRTPFDINPQAALSGDSGIGAEQRRDQQAGYELLLRIAQSDEPA